MKDQFEITKRELEDGLFELKVVNNKEEDEDKKGTVIIVRHNASFSELAKIAKLVAASVINADGEYKPWLRPVLETMGVMLTYTSADITDLSFDGLWDLYRSPVYSKIVSCIDNDELNAVSEWTQDLLYAREEKYCRNWWVEIANAVKDSGALETFVKFADKMKTNY